MRSRFCDASLLKAELDGYVLGQDEGVTRIATAISSHLFRIYAANRHSPSRIRKDNAMLNGPTGSGKTETFRVLQRLEDALGIPVIMKNAMDYAPSGSWKGTTVTGILDDLYLEADKMYDRKYNFRSDPKRARNEVLRMASNGIIMLDEFDKLSIHSGNTDNFSRDYQANLLKMVEGNVYNLAVREDTEDDGEGDPFNGPESVCLDTTNVMFIFLGAFDGLDKIIRKRLARERAKADVHEVGSCDKNQIGFTAKIRPVQAKNAQPAGEDLPEDTDLTPTVDDLVEYGIMRELAGRMPVQVTYKSLSIDNLVKIMNDSKTSVYHEYEERFRVMGHSLTCDNGALHEIARIATERKTGARGLSNIFYELLSPTIYKLSGMREAQNCLLRGVDILKGKQPELVPDRQQVRNTQ